MKHFKTISDYCKAINIPPPRYPHFDIRSFEENMPTVVREMPPFRHEFYAIAIKAEGEGKAISGYHTDFPEGTTVFFNSPFQILSWDIIPNWQGYYIMFSQDFIAQSKHFNQLLEVFPFLKIDKSIPFEVSEEDVSTLLNIYNIIKREYHSEQSDKFSFIESYVLILLHHIKRYFIRQVPAMDAEQQIRTADLKLLTRFQALVRTSFYPDTQTEPSSKLHSPAWYAQKLLIHPNYLNAVVKNSTGQTASAHIHNHLIQLAKAYLAQSDLSIKEIAYTLYFDAPNNFNTFFKKHSGITPLAYRKKALL